MPAIDVRLPRPSGQGDHKLLADVDELGWHVVAAEPEPSQPPFAFSVGMYYTLGSPEVVITGLPSQRAAEIINAIGISVWTGRPLPVSAPMSDILAGQHVVCQVVPPHRCDKNLRHAVWFYESLPYPFPCVQMFWPDPRGRFPWHEDCHPELRERQFDLTRSDS